MISMYLENTYHLDEEDGLLYKTDSRIRRVLPQDSRSASSWDIASWSCPMECYRTSVTTNLCIFEISRRMTLATDTSLVEALIPVPVQDHAWPPQEKIIAQCMRWSGVRRGVGDT
jgi:hypothetical protein